MARKIKLTQNQFAFVDDADYEWLNQHKWFARKHRNTYYAARTDYTTKPPYQIQMHREILGLKKADGKETDHQNGKGWDNRRTNLRICTRTQNAQNRMKLVNCTSNFKGVSQFGRKWMSYIRYNKKLIYLGLFASQKQAARAYDKVAKKYFGKFARLNFPNGQLHK